MEDKIRAYRKADTMGKSQLELILMVYDGAIKACRTAAEKYRDDDRDRGFEEVQKIKKFVTHLYTTLDPKKGGEIADNLGKMYVYILTQCYVVEATKDLEQLDAIAQMLDNIRSGWAGLRDRELAEQAKQPAKKDEEGPEEAMETRTDFVTTA